MLHFTFTVLYIRAAESWWKDGACRSLVPASFFSYHSADTWSAFYWLHMRLPVKIYWLHYNLMSLCGTECNAYISAIVLIESLVWRGCSVITLACRGSLLLFMQHSGCKTIYGHGDGYHRNAISPSADGVRAATSFLSLFLWKWDILKTMHLHRDQFNQKTLGRWGEVGVGIAFCLF